jgi:hypothetical protein
MAVVTLVGTLLSEAEVAELSEVLDGLIARGPDSFGVDEPAPVSFRSFSVRAGGGV